MAKQKTATKSKDPWTGRTWHLMTCSGPASPLMKPGADDGKKNRFRLVASSSAGNSKVATYKVKFKPGAMSKHWKDCVLVRRGKEPLALVDNSGAPLAAPGKNASPATIGAIAQQLVTAVDTKARIGTSRLECDMELPDMKLNSSNALVPTGKKQFGLLRLFQVPKALGKEAMLVLDFSIDRGLPGGSGGGGSVST